jgi:glycogen phosphorylase
MHWKTLRFGELGVETSGQCYMFRLPVYLDDLSPECVRVEIYADPAGDGLSLRQEMERAGQLAGSTHGYLYTAKVPATRPVAHYTPRIIPFHPNAQVPLEDAHILWLR